MGNTRPHSWAPGAGCWTRRNRPSTSDGILGTDQTMASSGHTLSEATLPMRHHDSYTASLGLRLAVVLPSPTRPKRTARYQTERRFRTPAACSGISRTSSRRRNQPAIKPRNNQPSQHIATGILWRQVQIVQPGSTRIHREFGRCVINCSNTGRLLPRL